MKSRSKKLKPNSLATLLKKYRCRQKKSQMSVSNLLRFKSGQYISNIERGRAQVSLKTLIKLVDIYHLDPDHVVKALLQDYELKIKRDFLQRLNKR